MLARKRSMASGLSASEVVEAVSSLPDSQHVQHAVLQHLGVGVQVVERAVVQAGQHGVGDVAHAGLQGQQLGRQAAHLHLVRAESR